MQRLASQLIASINQIATTAFSDQGIVNCMYTLQRNEGKKYVLFSQVKTINTRDINTCHFNQVAHCRAACEGFPRSVSQMV